MKIAIKVNPTRGKEIIKTLSDLGGKPSSYHGNGTIKNYCYFIDKKNNNKIEYDIPPTDYKIYTLEEFEKEFPFKVGDKVVWDKDNYTAIRTVLRIDYSDLAGIKYAITAFGAANCFWEVDANELKSYKEMKEERNITLTLDKAKEWYNKGGDLKQVALQAFTEEELTKIDLPKTWEEFLKVFPYSDAAKKAVKIMTDLPLRFSYQYEALLKLNYLRDYYAESYKGRHITDHYIYRNSVGFYNTGMDIVHHTLSFPSKHLADEFLKNFKDLINKASYLIA
jgi:hypothetical protein